MQRLTAPFVCFTCRKQFERKWDGKENIKICPECEGKSIRYDVKFKVPKKSDDAQWRKVEFLRDHGFYFQRVYDVMDDGVFRYTSYPKDIIEARTFVKRYAQFSENRD